MRRTDSVSFEKAAPELTDSIRSGDHGAFELFYRMEFLNLVHFANSYLQDKGKAEDIAQESLVSLWEHRRSLDPQRNIRALVFTIARNKTLDELRRRRFFGTLPADPESISALEDNSVDEYIGALELKTLMRNVWNSLPQKVAGTFASSRHEGLKNKEIALRDGVSEKTVEYRIRVALRQFKKILKFF